MSRFIKLPTAQEVKTGSQNRRTRVKLHLRQNWSCADKSILVVDDRLESGEGFAFPSGDQTIAPPAASFVSFFDIAVFH